MKAIYKYEIPADKMPGVAMPVGAEILHIGQQNDQVQLWALVDVRAPIEIRVFNVIGTGVKIDFNPGKYMATVMSRDHTEVVHVFDANAHVDDDL